MKITIIIIVTAIMYGCASMGTKITEEQFKKIVVGKTTESALLKILGEPSQYLEGMPTHGLPPLCSQKGASVKYLTYHYAKGSFLGTDETESYNFLINQAGILCHKTKMKMNPMETKYGN